MKLSASQRRALALVLRGELAGVHVHGWSLKRHVLRSLLRLGLVDYVGGFAPEHPIQLTSAGAREIDPDLSIRIFNWAARVPR